MKIAIIYYITPGTIKYTNWHDGFTKAIEILKNDELFEIDMINFYNSPNIELNNYNFVFIKWGFGSIMQTYAQNYFKTKNKKCKMGIFISSIKIPTDDEIKFFDVMFYETQWYNEYANLSRHKNIYHAFGIDSNVMINMNIDKIYDYIFVGNITAYKRPLNLIKKSGKKLVVGFLSDKNIINELEKNNIEIKNFVKYEELAYLYNVSKICYVPCEINGGGERSVLEARSCNLKVEIEDDNQKLRELLNSKIYDSFYYAKQIEKGILNTVNENIKNCTNLFNYYLKSKLTIVQIGAMDGVKFDKIYPYIINNNNVQAYLFEPVKYYYDKLINNYKKASGSIQLINYAISDNDDNIDLNIIDPNEIEKQKLPEFLMGISSIYDDRNSLSKEYWDGRGKINTEKFGWTYNNIIEKYKTKISVKSMKAKTFIQIYSINKIDILSVSASGHDFHIIKDFINELKPKYIKFEYNNLPLCEYEQCEKLLLMNNYKTICYNNQDCLAIYLN